MLSIFIFKTNLTKTKNDKKSNSQIKILVNKRNENLNLINFSAFFLKENKLIIRKRFFELDLKN